MSTVHVMLHKHTAYWGTCMRQSAMHAYGIIMRRKPMKLGHWYGNKHNVVMVSKQGDYFIIQYVSMATGVNTISTVRCCETRFIMWGTKICHHGESMSEVHCFLNRMAEYPGSPYIPMHKKDRMVPLRWRNQELHLNEEFYAIYRPIIEIGLPPYYAFKIWDERQAIKRSIAA